jgi:exonuclease SbcC
MRPLRLQLKGFTSFREPAEIDFSPLDVFAISGPTGSGKSSLLDAMTYALYGRVERVGEGVKQLISQGQPRMAVTLEFEVGSDRYRVTRSTPSGRGATKILLERQERDGDWTQAGDGADRVRDAERTLARLIGLTYDGFTRSVLLPQGKFAEFLVGDAKKRRDILTELLGLSLFRRMAERAGAIGKETTIRAHERGLSLEREYAGATPEALKAARQAAKDAEREEQALATAAEAVVEIMGRWQESKRSAEELRLCAAEASNAADQAARAAQELGELAGRVDDAAGRVDQCVTADRVATRALQDAEEALRQADTTLGSAEGLADAQLSAHSLAEIQAARAKGEARRAALARAADVVTEILAAADSAIRDRTVALAAREAEASAAEAALEDARHADLVAAVSAGLKAGDPCPVCGLPLVRAPRKAGAAGGFERARTRFDQAKRSLDAAAAGVTDAEGTADAARRDAEANAGERDRLAAEIEELDGAEVKGRRKLAAVLGDPLPADPSEEIEARLEQLRGLDRAERDATRDAAQSAQALLKAQQELERVEGLIDRHRERLTVDHGPLVTRARRALSDDGFSVAFPDLPTGDQAGDLHRSGEQMAEALGRFAELLAQELHARESVEVRFLQEATDRVGGVVEPAGTLEGLAQAVNGACRAATANVATTAKEAADLAGRLERKRELAHEVQELEGRARLFKALALELRADRLVAFLQAEALQLLAAAGSTRLANLSDGRYRLVCRDDEFLVVDTWNGDEERSVRTLSGGETFLASLALALALADQVGSLSVTDRAGLDSLFLDEGFGTLDPDTLRTVTDAIELLAGDGRLVGVITHVKELAEQFPRVEVHKDRIGSTLELVV